MSTATSLSATRAKRASGAMILFAFGGAWLGLWAWTEHAAQPVALLAMSACTLALVVSAWRVYRAHAPALQCIADSPEERRKGKLFHYINAAQWVAILVVANVLTNTGLRDFVLPAVIFVVGLHFLPLARLFAYPPHLVTGTALLALALAGPPSGARGGLALGTGLILWCSAAWAIRPIRP